MTKQLDYNALVDLIALQNWWFSPAELHAIATAFICARRDQTDLITFLFPAEKAEKAEKTALTPLGKEALSHLMNYLNDALAANDLHFQLLLPEGEHVTLKERAQTLVIWVEGFLLAINHLAPQLDGESLAFLADLQQFTQLDDNLNETEDNSRLLNTLEEHCRLGALMIYAHCHTNTPAPNLKTKTN